SGKSRRLTNSAVLAVARLEFARAKEYYSGLKRTKARGRNMSCVKWLILFSVLWMLPATNSAAENLPADRPVLLAKIPNSADLVSLLAKDFSTEELSADKLVVQAEIHRRVEGSLGYGFSSLWVITGKRLTRVDPADNSVVDIEIPDGGGLYRALAMGEGAV